jgi:hypothetical protein
MAPGFFGRFFHFVYIRFGAPGLLSLPFISLTCEKVLYDTVQAARGYDIYSNGPRDGAKGGFPSGGSELPSFSLIPVQKWDSNKKSSNSIE